MNSNGYAAKQKVPEMKRVVLLMLSLSLPSGALAAPMLDPTTVFKGKYRYIEENYDGEMEVLSVSGCEVNRQLGCLGTYIFKLRISTLEKTAGRDCDITAYENSAARITSGSGVQTVFDAKEDNDHLQFDVWFDKSQGGRAIIDKVTGWFDDGKGVRERNTYARGFCAPSTFFRGRWKRIR
jgi:hypothetical protein